MQKTMSHKTILTITEPAARLDRFLHQEYPSISKNRWREALTAGRVAIDDRRATKGSSLSRGQTVSFATELISELTAELRPAAEPNLEIVYQDENLLALNKPANCHTHPLAAAETGTLTNHLIAIFPELAGVGEFGPLQPGLLNRLDFATSGIVLAARSNSVWHGLRQQFTQHQIRKEYLADVSGVLKTEIVIENDLTHDRRDRRRMTATPPADPCRGIYPAKTEISPIKIMSGDNLTRVRLIMYSGVMHQLRVHLADIGHPILGDELYGKTATPNDNTRQAETNTGSAATSLHLHCAKMTLADGLEVTAPLPEWGRNQTVNSNSDC
jgi:23S rRNA pseudouridine1911/1915/1917 synthase